MIRVWASGVVFAELPPHDVNASRHASKPGRAKWSRECDAVRSMGTSSLRVSRVIIQVKMNDA